MLFTGFMRGLLAGSVGLIGVTHPDTAHAEQPTVRIMPLGDSITQGDRDGYRRPLWHLMQQAELRVDFVGSMDRGYAAADRAQDYDGDHEGHVGWRADEVLKHIDRWATRAEPDIVLLHLGTNDIGIGQDIEETIGEIERIISRLRTHNPRIDILLAAIIPVDHGRVGERFRKFNAGLTALSRQLDTTASRVVLIDQWTGFDAAIDTRDGVHPNESGNRKMAEKWLAGLKMLLK